jgi:hypothetical protein
MHGKILASVAGLGGSSCIEDSRLREAVDRLQVASHGSVELDALIEATLATLSACIRPTRIAGFSAGRRARWSSDLGETLTLLPDDYNFSVGQRDGICWAWIQPNDDWLPGEYEARHDHPRGSGLIVAYTAALAMTVATIILYTGSTDPCAGPGG